MITDDKITEIFCATDEFSKKFDEEIENMPLLTSDGKTRRRRATSMSDSEMTILLTWSFGQGHLVIFNFGNAVICSLYINKIFIL